MGDGLPNALSSLNLADRESFQDTSSEDYLLNDQNGAQRQIANNTESDQLKSIESATKSTSQSHQQENSTEIKFNAQASSSSLHLSTKQSPQEGHNSPNSPQNLLEKRNSKAKSSISYNSRVRSNGSPGSQQLDDRTLGRISVHEISTSDCSHLSSVENPSTNSRYQGSESDQSRPSGSQPKEVLPLDDIDLFLPNASPLPSRSNTNKAMGANRRIPESFSAYKAGIISFSEHSGDVGDEDLVRSDDGTSSLSDNVMEKSLHGVRRKQTVTRKLEAENMELRLKLQQYREMNASEQEISRAKRQLARSEKRIDELEQALERKNQTIRELCEQRDQAMQIVQSDKTKELYETIEELQTAITQLEEESVEAEKVSKGAIAQAHADLPNIIPENASMTDLLTAIRRLTNEKLELQSIASSASSLKSQHGALRDVLSKAGRPGDPLLSIQELLSELTQLRSENSSIREVLGKENRELRRESERILESHRVTVQDLEQANEKLEERVKHEEAVRQELEVKVVELEKLLMGSRATSYSIIRGFFAELFNVMGPDFQTNVEQQLAKIMNLAKEEGQSKIPLLLDLLVEYTRKLGQAALKSELKPQQDRKIWALEKELQSLEHMMDLKWSRAGADAVLIAQVRDLKRQLKLEGEKRKSEWMEYQHSIERARRQN